MKTTALVFASLAIGGLADREYFENGKICIAPKVTVTKTVYHTTVQGAKTTDVDDDDHAYGQHPATGKKWPTGVYDAWASLSAKAWPWASASVSADNDYEHGYGYDPKKPYNKAGVTSTSTKNYSKKPGYGGDHDDYSTPCPSSSAAAGYGGYKGDKDTYSKNGVNSKDGSAYSKDGSAYSKDGTGYAKGKGPNSDAPDESYGASSRGQGHSVVGPSSAGHGGFPSFSRWANSSSIATSKTSSVVVSSKSSSVLSSSKSSSVLSSSKSSSVLSSSKSSSVLSSSKSSSVSSSSASASVASSSLSSSKSSSSGSSSSSVASSSSSSSSSPASSSSVASSASSSSSSSVDSSSSSSSASSTITSSSSSVTSSASSSLSSSSSVISSSSSSICQVCSTINNANIGPQATGIPGLSCGAFDDTPVQLPVAEVDFPVRIYGVESNLVWVSPNGLISITDSPGRAAAQEPIPSDNVNEVPTVFAYWSDWYGFAPQVCVQPYGVFYNTDATSFGVEWFVQYYDIQQPDERYRVQFSAQTFLTTPGVWTYRYYKIPDRALTDALTEPPEYIGAQLSSDGPAVQYAGDRPTAGTTIVCDTNVSPGTCVKVT